MKAVIYARVSTNHQSNSRQINELKNIDGLEAIKTFNESISGYTKGYKERPQLKAALKFIEENNVDCLMVHEISRLGRRTEEVLQLINYLKDRGIKLYIKSLNVLINKEDSQSEAITKLLVTIMTDLARMESETLSYRIKSGLQERKRKHLAIGRQFGSVETKEKFLNKHKKIIKYLNQGESIRYIATKLNVSPTTVQKVKMAITSV